MSVTLARYWDKFDKDDMAFLMIALNMTRDKHLHMGKLPFVSAAVAYKAVFQYPPGALSPKGAMVAQRLLQILAASYFPVHTEVPKDWKYLNQKIIRPPE